MDINPVTFWILLPVIAVVAGVIGFVLGRRKAPGGAEEVERLIAEYEAKQQELETYQHTVHQHYNQTADIFKNMAGSYKDLFEHLSVGYQQLGDPEKHSILPAKASSLLEENDDDDDDDDDSEAENITSPQPDEPKPQNQTP